MLGTVSVAHAQYPPSGGPGLSLTREVGPPGFTFVATVTNCFPGERVVFRINGVSYEAICDPTSLQASVTITAPDAVGPYTIFADVYGPCTNAPAPCFVLSEVIQVVAAAPPTTVPSPPTTIRPGVVASTGTNAAGPITVTAALLVVTGLCVLAVSRRRRRPAVVPSTG
jgi:hypothetical protein